MGCAQSLPCDHPRIFKAKNVNDDLKSVFSVILEVQEENLIILSRKRKVIVIWPIASVKKYGCSNDLLFVESSADCTDGKGRYLFKCARSQELFMLLKEKWNAIQARCKRNCTTQYTPLTSSRQDQAGAPPRDQLHHNGLSLDGVRCPMLSSSSDESSYADMKANVFRNYHVFDSPPASELAHSTWSQQDVQHQVNSISTLHRAAPQNLSDHWRENNYVNIGVTEQKLSAVNNTIPYKTVSSGETHNGRKPIDRSDDKQRSNTNEDDYVEMNLRGMGFSYRNMQMSSRSSTSFKHQDNNVTQAETESNYVNVDANRKKIYTSPRSNGCMTSRRRRTSSIHSNSLAPVPEESVLESEVPPQPCRSQAPPRHRKVYLKRRRYYVKKIASNRRPDTVTLRGNRRPYIANRHSPKRAATAVSTSNLPRSNEVARSACTEQIHFSADQSANSTTSVIKNQENNSNNVRIASWKTLNSIAPDFPLAPPRSRSCPQLAPESNDAHLSLESKTVATPRCNQQTYATTLHSDPWVLRKVMRDAQPACSSTPSRLGHDYVNTTNVSSEVSGFPLPAAARAVGTRHRFDDDLLKQENLNRQLVYVRVKTGSVRDGSRCRAASWPSQLSTDLATDYVTIDYDMTRALAIVCKAREEELKSRRASAKVENGVKA